jgi:hypothetical protein
MNLSPTIRIGLAADELFEGVVTLNDAAEKWEGHPQWVFIAAGRKGKRIMGDIFAAYCGDDREKQEKLAQIDPTDFINMEPALAGVIRDVLSLLPKRKRKGAA